MNLEQEFLEMRPKGSYFHRGFESFCKELKKHNIKNVIEIGSYIGESIVLFKEFLGDDVNVISIDPFINIVDEHDLLNTQNFNVVEEEYNKRTAHLNNFAKLKFYSDDAYKFLKEGYFDLVYVDGLHTYDQVKKDIINYLPLLKENGIMSGHDYYTGDTKEQEDFHFDYASVRILRQNVKRAVNETLVVPDATFEDSSWLKFKTNI